MSNLSYARKIALSFLAIMLVFGTVLPNAASAWPICVKIGNPTNRCTGLGICGIIIGPLNASEAFDRAIFGSAELKDNHLIVTIDKPAGTPMKSFPVPQNYALTQEAAAELGFKKVTVLKGDYEIDTSDGSLGTIAFKVKAEGKVKVPRDAASGQATGKRQH